MSLTIAIDSREQCPYEFEGHTEVKGLSVGDYSLAGLEHLISIERKTVDDLIACLTTGRDRFERELYKGRALDYFAFVVEASLSDIANGRYQSDMLPKAAIQSLVAFSVRYRLPVWFCDNRKYGQRVTESLLQKYVREIEKRHEAVQKHS